MFFSLRAVQKFYGFMLNVGCARVPGTLPIKCAGVINRRDAGGMTSNSSLTFVREELPTILNRNADLRKKVQPLSTLAIS